MKRQYRVKKETDINGVVKFIPQTKRLWWSSVYPTSYNFLECLILQTYICYNTLEDAEKWIFNDIKWREKIKRGKQIEYFSFRTEEDVLKERQMKLNRLDYE